MNKLLMSFLTLLGLLTCRDFDSDPLPAATQIGANTFGCKLNGVVFVPNAGVSTIMDKPLVVYGYYSGTENHSKRIEAFRGHDTKNLLYIDVYIFQINKLGAGNYQTGNAPEDDFSGPFYSYIKCRAVSPKTKKYRDYGTFDNTGKIQVTRYDRVNFILSGTFSGRLKALDGEEYVEITDGRFDINLKTL